VTEAGDGAKGIEHRLAPVGQGAEPEIEADPGRKPTRAEIPDDGRLVAKPCRPDEFFEEVDDLMHKSGRKRYSRWARGAIENDFRPLSSFRVSRDAYRR
jgi:hypothetical protein